MKKNTYESWKNGEKVYKAKLVIDFWKTNPTKEQRLLWSKVLVKGVTIGLVCGIMFGIVIGMICTCFY